MICFLCSTGPVICAAKLQLVSWIVFDLCFRTWFPCFFFSGGRGGGGNCGSIDLNGRC